MISFKGAPFEKEMIETERGAHTIAFDADRNKVYAFLLRTHRAVVYLDRGA
jgi:hypothetical protein